METITINLDDYNKMKKENEELKEQRDKVISLSEQTIREIKQKYQEKIDDIAEFAKELQNDYKKHIMEIEEPKKENEGYEQMKKIFNVKTDLINELFSKIIKDADIDDGIGISKEYGNKYIDEWNKIYEDIIKDTIETMNHNEFDCDELYLKFHTCDNIEFCNPETDEEEDSD